MQVNSEDMREWLSNPCTIAFKNAIEEAISQIAYAPRLISESVEATALMNAKLAGCIEGLEEIEEIINDLIGGNDEP